MKKWYFTFGQSHKYVLNIRGEDVVLDKDVVLEIEASCCSEARDKMWSVFKDKWAFQYDELPDMKFFPRGIIGLDIEYNQATDEKNNREAPGNLQGGM